MPLSRILSRPLRSHGPRQILSASMHRRLAARFNLTRTLCFVVLICLVTEISANEDESVCYGGTSDGRLENGWKLPVSGSNFSAYSTVGRALGRTYVHSTVHSIVLDAYARVFDARPDKAYVYGETGRENGGEFKPHKTHKNGLSVDFMVPILNADGDSVPLQTSALNKWGYDLEFDSSGRLGDVRIDAEAMAEHLYHLHRSALDRGVEIWRVIFAPDLQHLLHDTEYWPYLSEHLSFSTRQSWVRHDQHYHVDFEVPCEPAA